MDDSTVTPDLVREIVEPYLVEKEWLYKTKLGFSVKALTLMDNSSTSEAPTFIFAVHYVCPGCQATTLAASHCRRCVAHLGSESASAVLDNEHSFFGDLQLAQSGLLKQEAELVRKLASWAQRNTSKDPLEALLDAQKLAGEITTFAEAQISWIDDYFSTVNGVSAPTAAS